VLYFSDNLTCLNVLKYFTVLHYATAVLAVSCEFVHHFRWIISAVFQSFFPEYCWYRHICCLLRYLLWNEWMDEWMWRLNFTDFGPLLKSMMTCGARPCKSSGSVWTWA